MLDIISGFWHVHIVNSVFRPVKAISYLDEWVRVSKAVGKTAESSKEDSK
jgi:hypothetical protein